MPQIDADDRGSQHRSADPGIANISAVVLDDGVYVANTASVTFTPYMAPTGDFLWTLDHLVTQADDSLNELSDDAQAIASDGDYFRGAIAADSAKLALDALFNMSDVVGGVVNTARLQEAAKLACPGCYHGSSAMVAFASDYPRVTQLLNAGFTDLASAPATSIAEHVGWGNPKFYAFMLGLIPVAGKSYTKNQAVQAMQDVFANLPTGMTNTAYPGIQDTANDLTAQLSKDKTKLLANLPAMSVDYQNGYVSDMVGRTKALYVLAQRLDNYRTTLYNFRANRNRDSTGSVIANFLLRYVAHGLAKGVFDGPGTAAVGGTLFAFDNYMDSQQLNETVQMHSLAAGALTGAPDALGQTYATAFSAIGRIGLGLPGGRASGQILNVSHFSQSSGWGPFWSETASWSEVTLKNTGSTRTTFSVVTRYLADTSRFGVPWATMDLVEEPTMALDPGASGTVRVDYKRSNGKGFSPRSQSCCVQASSIDMDVLGNNEAGTYYIANTRTTWQPTVVSTNQIRTIALNTPAIIDPPLTSYVLSAPPTQQFQAQLWINDSV